MTHPLIVVSGTGTEIGKTHTSEALLRLWGQSVPARGLKPVETGIRAGAEGDDARRLRVASTFHVKPWPVAPFAFPDPVSPHLAARRIGTEIDASSILEMVNTARAEAPTLVELAGGLFSPLTPRLNNADIARALAPTALLLVAPDRLGVLHDIAAATRAATAMQLAITAIVLVTPEVADTSTGANAAEAPLVTDVPVVAVIPRATVEILTQHPAIAATLAAALRRG